MIKRVKKLSSSSYDVSFMSFKGLIVSEEKSSLKALHDECEQAKVVPCYSSSECVVHF